MIHLLGWVAVALTGAYSYLRRSHLDPEGVLDHRAGLPAVAFASAMLVILVMLVTTSNVGTV